LILHIFGKNINLKIENIILLLTKNNKIFMNSKLKDIIIRQTLIFSKMCEKQIEIKNINNYIINSNNNLIKYLKS
jgi:hypothetical protein